VLAQYRRSRARRSSASLVKVVLEKIKDRELQKKYGNTVLIKKGLRQQNGNLGGAHFILVEPRLSPALC